MTDAVARLNAALADRYRIERELGAGGMATVYLAEDLKHRRKVALKVLKPELAAVVGADRFLAEIQTTANLQHPHILPLFDSGEADSFLFYVMPYVEGETLRDRLDREHQLPVDEAVRIATAVASALDYAHRHKVIHRDIKPENILLHEGQPLVADFGIALAVGAAGGGRLTETGLSLGTPYYMSPEQATGDQRVGPQADIYALGCVLYEMLVGEPPHTGNSAQAVLAKILAGARVSPSAQRPSIPANADAAIRNALEKLPADRFSSAQEFAKALSEPSFRYGNSGDHAARVSRVGFGLLAAGGGALAVLVVLAVVRLGVSSPERRPVTFPLTFPENQRLVPAVGVGLTWSPDGTRFVYVGPSATSSSQLWQRPLDQLGPQPIPGSDGARNPVISPDGASVAFTVAGSLKTLPLAGGQPTTVVAAGVSDFGIDWGSDGMLYFTRSDGADQGVERVLASGGTPKALTTPAPGTVHKWVDALPGGEGVLFTIGRGSQTAGQNEIAVVPAKGGEFRTLLPGRMARYARSGHLVYTDGGGTLMAARFDARRLEVTGPSVALRQGITDYNNGGQFALSDAGSLLFNARAAVVPQIVRVTRSGESEEIEPGWTAPFGSIALSPDGTRLAVSIGTGTSGTNSGDQIQDIWIKQLDRGPLTKLTLEKGVNYRAEWTPDGRSLSFLSNRKDTAQLAETDLWVTRADGSGKPELLSDLDRAIKQAAWSRDRQWLVFRVGTQTAPGENLDIFGWRPKQDSVPTPLVATRANEFTPSVSPDARWLAYVSDESGQNEVYVRPFPNVGDGKWQLSSGGGTEPVWAHNGHELFYRGGDLEMVAAEVAGSGPFKVVSTRVLFPASDYRSEGAYQSYVLTPDDEHFIMVHFVRPTDRQDFVVVENFFDELKARVGK